MHMLQLVSSPADGHLGLFNLLAVKNSAGVNVSVHIFIWIPVFNCFEYIPRCRITRLFGNPAFIFSKNGSRGMFQGLYFKGWTIFLSFSNAWGFWFFYICDAIYSFSTFLIVTLESVVLICISLVTKDNELCFYAFWPFSWDFTGWESN